MRSVLSSDGAYARDYVDVAAGVGQPQLRPMYKRGLLPSFLLGALFLGWLLVEGGATIELASGFLDLIAGLALRETRSLASLRLACWCGAGFSGLSS